MYIPKAFREDDIHTLQTFIQKYSFATLITQENGVPLASHLPFLLDTKRGPYGVLQSHMARANPQWQSFNISQEALVIFQGPHTYISPSWYETELSVPTWNYAVVHAYGAPKLIEEPAELYKLLEALVQTYESLFEKPWKFQLPTEYIHKMMAGVVGFEIPINRLEGKFKLSQNRSASDQARVVAALKDSGDEQSVNVATFMNERGKIK